MFSSQPPERHRVGIRAGRSPEPVERLRFEDDVSVEGDNYLCRRVTVSDADVPRTAGPTWDGPRPHPAKERPSRPELHFDQLTGPIG
jgi:hypothetical protein